MRRFILSVSQHHDERKNETLLIDSLLYNHYHQAFLLPPLFLSLPPLVGATVGILLRRTRRFTAALPPLLVLPLPFVSDGAVEGFGVTRIRGTAPLSPLTVRISPIWTTEVVDAVGTTDGWEEVEGFELGVNEGYVLGDKDGSDEGLDERESTVERNPQNVMIIQNQQ